MSFDFLFFKNIINVVFSFKFLGGSLFSHGEVYINETLVSAAGSLYNYRTYLETENNYCSAAKESWLTKELYYEDTAGAFDDVVSIGNAKYNQGLSLRKAITDLGPFDMMFTPHLEGFNQDRICIPSDLRLKFIRSPPEFYIMNVDETKEYKI